MLIADCQLPIANFETQSAFGNWQSAIGNRQPAIGIRHNMDSIFKDIRYGVRGLLKSCADKSAHSKEVLNKI